LIKERGEKSYKGLGEEAVKWGLYDSFEVQNIVNPILRYVLLKDDICLSLYKWKKELV